MKYAPRSATPIAISVAATLHAQSPPPDSLRLVVATGTTCHSLPDAGSPIAERYHLGDVVGASKSTRGLGGRIWYFDAWRVKGISPACWVPANATVPLPGDECGADCFLGMIAYGPQQYWTRLPNGRSIGRVLTLATRLADEAIAGIEEEPPTRAAIDGVRSSLARVDFPGKQALLDRLARLDRAVKP